MKEKRNILNTWSKKNLENLGLQKMAATGSRFCVWGGLVSFTCQIAQKLIQGTAFEFSTEPAITQNCCYAPVLFY